MKGFDLVGNIAIMKFGSEKVSEKKKKAEKLLKENKNLKTVVEKVDKVKGRLRTLNVKHLAGEKNMIADYKENNCRFRFDIEKCYFSPRLSEERKIVSKMVKKNDSVLVMFSGAGFFPIVIAKFLKNRFKDNFCVNYINPTRPPKNVTQKSDSGVIKSIKQIVSVELGKVCCQYAKENILLNKLDDRIEVIQGDVKRVIPRLSLEINTPTKFALQKPALFHHSNSTPRVSNLKIVNVPRGYKFDLIIMPRPQLKETFLKDALRVSKKGTRIIYYGFARVDDKQDMVDELKKEGGRKIKILRVVKAGNLAPYKFRWRVEIAVK